MFLKEKWLLTTLLCCLTLLFCSTRMLLLAYPDILVEFLLLVPVRVSSVLGKSRFWLEAPKFHRFYILNGKKHKMDMIQRNLHFWSKLREQNM